MTTNASSKAAIRDNFLQHLQQLVAHQQQRYEAVGQGSGADFYSPPPSDWSGDLHDHEGIAAAFDRTPQYEDFQYAASQEGVQGDFELTLLQGDWIASLERAFRSRHRTAVRSRLHAAARYRGHAHPAGVLPRGLQGYLEWLDKQAKELRE